jgi:hypothetical protein
MPALTPDDATSTLRDDLPLQTDGSEEPPTLRSPMTPAALAHAFSDFPLSTYANDNATVVAPTTPILERDLESVIVSAACGEEVAKELLRTIITRLALDSLVTIAAAKRVTERVLRALGHPTRGPGRPLPGRAVAWLENVVRTYASYDFARTSRARWARWDPPGRMDGP